VRFEVAEAATSSAGLLANARRRVTSHRQPPERNAFSSGTRWSISKSPGAVVVMPSYGETQEPVMTLHVPARFTVAGTTDHAMSASCRASQPLPSTSSQWGQASRTYGRSGVERSSICRAASSAWGIEFGAPRADDGCDVVDPIMGAEPSVAVVEVVALLVLVDPDCVVDPPHAVTRNAKTSPASRTDARVGPSTPPRGPRHSWTYAVGRADLLFGRIANRRGPPVRPMCLTTDHEARRSVSARPRIGSESAPKLNTSAPVRAPAFLRLLGLLRHLGSGSSECRGSPMEMG
jgi:hypothetical protein